MNRHLTPGCKTAILINGIPASGKSTITRLLAETFSLPVLTIDGIKEPFMARLAPVDRPMNRQLGCAAYEVIWSIVGASPASMVWLIDAWFGFQPRETLQRLLQQAGVEQVIEVWNHISPELAVARYASRLATRPPGHPGEEYLPELAQLAGRAQPMSLGPVLTIDQRHPLQIEPVIQWLVGTIAGQHSGFTDYAYSSSGHTRQAQQRGHHGGGDNHADQRDLAPGEEHSESNAQNARHTGEMCALIESGGQGDGKSSTVAASESSACERSENASRLPSFAPPRRIR